MRFKSDLSQQHPAILLLRFTLAILVLLHGIAKLRGGVGPIESMLQAQGVPGVLAYAVFIGEVVAPLLIIAGIWVRAAALLIAINMVVAVALAHSKELLQLDQTGGYALELQAFFLVTALVVAWLAGKPTR
jgi:putative oxidoreductase